MGDTVRLIDFIDFEDSIAQAIDQGYQSSDNCVSVIVGYDQIDATKEALDRLIHIGEVITRGLVIHSYENCHNTFTVKLDIP